MRLKTFAECDEAMARLRELDRAAAKFVARRDARVDKAKADCAEVVKPLKDERKALEERLEEWVDRNWKDEFAVRKAKSLKGKFGVLGRRLGGGELKTIGKTTWAKAVEAVREVLGKRYIRTKEEVDRDAVKTAKFDVNKLRAARLQIAPRTDEFFVDVED